MLFVTVPPPPVQLMVKVLAEVIDFTMIPFPAVDVLLPQLLVQLVAFLVYHTAFMDDPPAMLNEEK